jgi:hypothetical protein
MSLLSPLFSAVMPLLFTAAVHASDGEEHQFFQHVETSRGRMDIRFRLEQDRTLHLSERA